MSISVADGSCTFQENAEKQISVEEDTPPGIHIVQYTTYNIQLIIFFKKFLSFSGTELFIVRAYPRRLFNIQAVDGVSITLSLTHINVKHCNQPCTNIQQGRPQMIPSFLIVSVKIKTAIWPEPG